MIKCRIAGWLAPEDTPEHQYWKASLRLVRFDGSPPSEEARKAFEAASKRMDEEGAGEFDSDNAPKWVGGKWVFEPCD